MLWVHLVGRVSANQYEVIQSDHLYPMMKHFCAAGSGFTPIQILHEIRGVSEWLRISMMLINSVFLVSVCVKQISIDNFDMATQD